MKTGWLHGLLALTMLHAGYLPAQDAGTMPEAPAPGVAGDPPPPHPRPADWRNSSTGEAPSPEAMPANPWGRRGFGDRRGEPGGARRSLAPEQPGGPCSPNGPEDDGEGEGTGRAERLLGMLSRDGKLAEYCGISTEQIRTLQDAIHELRRREIELRAKKELAALEQARLMTQKDATEEQLLQAVEQTGQVQIEMAKLAIRRLLLVRRSLSDEQMAKIHEAVGARMREHARSPMQRPRGVNRAADERAGEPAPPAGATGRSRANPAESSGPAAAGPERIPAAAGGAARE